MFNLSQVFAGDRKSCKYFTQTPTYVLEINCTRAKTDERTLCGLYIRRHANDENKCKEMQRNAKIVVFYDTIGVRSLTGEWNCALGLGLLIFIFI